MFTLWLGIQQCHAHNFNINFAAAHLTFTTCAYCSVKFLIFLFFLPLSLSLQPLHATSHRGSALLSWKRHHSSRHSAVMCTFGNPRQLGAHQTRRLWCSHSITERKRHPRCAWYEFYFFMQNFFARFIFYTFCISSDITPYPDSIKNLIPQRHTHIFQL